MKLALSLFLASCSTANSTISPFFPIIPLAYSFLVAHSVALANLLHGGGVTFHTTIPWRSNVLTPAFSLTVAPVTRSPLQPLSNGTVYWRFPLTWLPCTLFNFSETVVARFAAVCGMCLDPSGTQLLIAITGFSTYAPWSPGAQFAVRRRAAQATRGQLFTTGRVARIYLLKRTAAELPVPLTILCNIPVSPGDSIAGCRTFYPVRPFRQLTIR
mmetsp:Transcript_79109/g.156690  ORF Transcript_79109/g.156690 Transcript_79109/m.156690 type:complete len:214 (-) Transcript_79109:524-1165(-)